MKDKIKISTQSNLQRFLKILAEESVMKAELDMSKAHNERDRQRKVAYGIKAASGVKYVTEEDEEAAKPAAPAAPKQVAAQPEPVAEPEPEAKPKPSQADAVEDVTGSLDALVRAIKEIRGGLSVKDSVVEDNMEAYFDSLSEPEQLALVITLKSISHIMSKPDVDVTSLQTPESQRIMTTQSEDAQKAKKPEPAPPAETTSTGKATPAGEDTEPPIKTGEPVSEMYRAKIKQLLSRV